MKLLISIVRRSRRWVMILFNLRGSVNKFKKIDGIEAMQHIKFYHVFEISFIK